MKKILLISIALLFGCTLFAQSNADYPEYPNVTYYKCTQMISDVNQLPPWVGVNSGPMYPDCFPPSCYANTKQYEPTPPVSGPGCPVTKYNPEMMKPDYPSYPVHLKTDQKPQIMIY
ncbi:hypothetical protein ACFLS7_04250 [Bacteroidota bacterium]